MSAREEFCIALLVDCLEKERGRRFRVLCKLDELVRTQPAPDFLLSDDEQSIAVEIKRATFVGHKELDLAILIDRGRVTPFVQATGEPATWGEVTTRGVRFTDVNTVIAITLADAARKFIDADWADERVVILDLDPGGSQDPRENLSDLDYWEADDFEFAIETAELPVVVDHVYGTFDNEIFLGQSQDS